MSSGNKEDPLYCLNSSYNAAALQHVAVVAGLVVATFAYMGLSLKGNNPSWGLGSFAILTALTSLTIYNLGRAHYYSVLTSFIASPKISALFCPTLPSVSREVQELLKNAAREKLRYKICLVFKRSFNPLALVLSILSGLGIALVLSILGFFVLWYDTPVRIIHIL
jgi:hypothetical protein